MCKIFVEKLLGKVQKLTKVHVGLGE